MTDTRAQERLDHFRRSVSLLSEILVDIPGHSQSLNKLSDLAGAQPSAESQPSHVHSLQDALDTLTYLQLLASADTFVQSSTNPAQEIESILDQLHKSVGEEMRKRPRTRVYGLYVIIDPKVTADRDPIDVARATLRGGAKVLQLRDKLGEKGRSLYLAEALKELCLEHDALLIINDHADLAAVTGADGLHVGQGDLPVQEARRVLHPHQIIGRSNHTVAELVESQHQGADHVAIGAVYPTTTKESIVRRATVGPEAVQKARDAVSVPLVAIGGISEDNVAPVVEAGADAICVTSAVGFARDPEEASKRLVEAILKAGGKA